MHQTARFVQRSDRRNSGRVRILQQASVMLGHCRMRSRSKPQSHARSAVGSSGPDEPRGWAGEGRSSPARKSVPANRIGGGWLLDLKGPRRAFYTTKLPAFQNARSAFFFCTPVTTTNYPEQQLLAAGKKKEKRGVLFGVGRLTEEIYKIILYNIIKCRFPRVRRRRQAHFQSDATRRPTIRPAPCVCMLCAKHMDCTCRGMGQGQAAGHCCLLRRGEGRGGVHMLRFSRL